MATTPRLGLSIARFHYRQWTSFYYDLPALNNFAIPRWTGQGSTQNVCEIHGFSDTSSSAYAAVVYMRVVDRDTTRISLLTSRTKVSPIKQLTMPRLELCAAVLLSRLIANLQEISRFSEIPVFCWSGATIVLHWLQQPPIKWQTFIANRVSIIQTLLPTANWQHVPGSQNPADIASRGCSATDLMSSSLWMSGPLWLQRDSEFWPRSTPPIDKDAPLEVRAHSSAITVCENDTLLPLTQRVSQWNRLLRPIAYAIRRRRIKSANDYSRGNLNYAELRRAFFIVIKWLQSILFANELNALRAHMPVSAKSSLISLQPFLDRDEVIRVGGRLRNADLSDVQKHPAALATHSVVRLLVSHSHVWCLHGGVTLTLQTLRRRVWIVQAKRVIRSVIGRCVTCARHRAQLHTQQMSSFPTPRVVPPEKAFDHCGVDYAGPVQVRITSGRGRKAHTAYISLFVCFAVKAIHLELVSDYTSAAFIAAFKRFTARRGTPSHMYSDCGTTFIGAQSELTRSFHAAIRDDSLKDLLANGGTTWHFLPPAAPHFGGLWEAGVKSVKHHLKRILRDQTPTFEELTTLFCQVEAALNSRPLGRLSEDVDDLTILTPGHFLTGGALHAVPEVSLLSLSTNRLSRWQARQKMYQRYWQLWSSDYLLSLQQRSKWRLVKTPLKVGQLVLIKRPNLPPTKWSFGRITICHPGSDGLIRVVTVRTATSVLVRTITQISLLPIDLEKNSDT